MRVPEPGAGKAGGDPPARRGGRRKSRAAQARTGCEVAGDKGPERRGEGTPSQEGLAETGRGPRKGGLSGDPAKVCIFLPSLTSTLEPGRLGGSWFAVLWPGVGLGVLLQLWGRVSVHVCARASVCVRTRRFGQAWEVIGRGGLSL